MYANGLFKYTNARVILIHSIIAVSYLLRKLTCSLYLYSFSAVLLGVTWFPDILNNFAEAQLVALMHKYFLPN